MLKSCAVTWFKTADCLIFFTSFLVRCENTFVICWSDTKMIFSFTIINIIAAITRIIISNPEWYVFWENIFDIILIWNSEKQFKRIFSVQKRLRFCNWLLYTSFDVKQFHAKERQDTKNLLPRHCTNDLASNKHLIPKKIYVLINETFRVSIVTKK